jgi:hypothetical protein
MTEELEETQKWKRKLKKTGNKIESFVRNAGEDFIGFFEDHLR